MAEMIWKVMDGYPRETWGADGKFTAIVKMMCDWGDRWEVASRWVDLRSEYPPFTEEYGGGHGVVALGPAQIEAFPGQQSNVALDGMDFSSYEKAVVTVKFGTPSGIDVPIDTPINDPRGRGDRISEAVEYNIEFATLNPELFEWVGGEGTNPVPAALKENEAPGRQEIGFDYIFTRLGVSHISPMTFELPGHVNATSIRSLSPLLDGKVFRPETLLYQKPSLSLERNRDGNAVIQAGYRFSYRPTGWNRIFRSDIVGVTEDGTSFRGGYDRIAIRQAPGEEIPIEDRLFYNYPLGEFNEL